MPEGTRRVGRPPTGNKRPIPKRKFRTIEDNRKLAELFKKATAPGAKAKLAKEYNRNPNTLLMNAKKYATRPRIANESKMKMYKTASRVKHHELESHLLTVVSSIAQL